MRKGFLLLLCSMLTLCGCTAGAGSVKQLTKAAAASIAHADTDAVIDTAPLNAFAAKIFSAAVADEKDNLVISPLSLYYALAMTQNGAAGETLQGFSDLLGGDTESINALCRNLSAKLMDTAGSTVLKRANSAWVDDDATIYESYLETIASAFGAEVYGADLPSNATKRAVNAWVKEKTQGMIENFRTENYPDETVMVLLDTLYLKAKWQLPFERANTWKNDFTREDGSTVSIDFMHDNECYRDYIETDGIDGVLLPYDDGKTALVALRATDGRSARALAAEITSDTIGTCLASASERLMNLAVPRFTTEYAINYSDMLAGMGLALAFDVENADFSAMGESEDGNIYISKVFQKVKLIVDEEGTEAAAVTAVEMAAGCALNPEQPIEMQLDKPFVYAVVDLESNALLFVGVLADPS